MTRPASSSASRSSKSPGRPPQRPGARQLRRDHRARSGGEGGRLAVLLPSPSIGRPRADVPDGSRPPPSSKGSARWGRTRPRSPPAGRRRRRCSPSSAGRHDPGGRAQRARRARSPASAQCARRGGGGGPRVRPLGGFRRRDRAGGGDLLRARPDGAMTPPVSPDPIVAELCGNSPAIGAAAGGAAGREEAKRRIIALFKRVNALIGDLGSLKEDIRGHVERYKQLAEQRDPACGPRYGPPQLHRDRLMRPPSSKGVEPDLGDPQGAIQALGRALELSPDDIQPNRSSAGPQMLAESYDDACSRGAGARPANASRVNVGYICLKKRIFGEAMKHHLRGSFAWDNPKASLYAPIWAWSISGAPISSAQGFLQKAIALGPNLIEAYYDLGAAARGWSGDRTGRARPGGGHCGQSLRTLGSALPGAPRQHREGRGGPALGLVLTILLSQAMPGRWETAQVGDILAVARAADLTLAIGLAEEADRPHAWYGLPHGTRAHPAGRGPERASRRYASGRPPSDLGSRVRAPGSPDDHPPGGRRRSPADPEARAGASGVARRGAGEGPALVRRGVRCRRVRGARPAGGAATERGRRPRQGADPRRAGPRAPERASHGRGVLWPGGVRGALPGKGTSFGRASAPC